MNQDLGTILKANPDSLRVLSIASVKMRYLTLRVVVIATSLAR